MRTSRPTRRHSASATTQLLMMGALALLAGGCITQSTPTDDDDQAADAGVITVDASTDPVDVGTSRDAAESDPVDIGTSRDAEEPAEDAAQPPPDAGDGLCDGVPCVEACPVAAVLTDSLELHSLEATVRLDGSPSTDPSSPTGQPVRFDWRVLQAARGSNQTVFEQFNDPAQPRNGGPNDNPETPTAAFYPNVAGQYLFELVVTGANGLIAPSPRCPQPAATMTVTQLSSDSGIYVELTWETPGAPISKDGVGSDVDLHLLHPRGLDWNIAPLDCYYANNSPDWGPAGPEGDPELRSDSVNGDRPEAIELRRPEDTEPLGAPYRIGAELFSTVDASIPTEVTLRVLLQGELAFETTREMWGSGEFWEIAEVYWGPEPHVEPVD